MIAHGVELSRLGFFRSRFSALSRYPSALWSCDAIESEAAERAGPPAEDDFAQLGPIEFERLLPTLESAAVHEAPDVLNWYALTLREIAREHGQRIPDRIEEYLRRFEGHSGGGTV